METGCESTSIITDEILFAISSYNISFIGRYLNHVPYYHIRLSPSEAQRISAAGIYIVSIFGSRSGGDISYFTPEQGKKDVIEALCSAAKVGQPHSTPIYFSIDCDADQLEIEKYIEPYFKAINGTLKNKNYNPNNYKLGIYGSRRVCACIRGKNPATTRYTWVAGPAADSGYFNDWNILQGAAMTIGSGEAEIEIKQSWSSVHGDGGWQVQAYADTVCLSTKTERRAMLLHGAPNTFVLFYREPILYAGGFSRAYKLAG